jgi:hypothetical protein
VAIDEAVLGAASDGVRIFSRESSRERIAAALPAWRVSRIDPLRAMREG